MTVVYFHGFGAFPTGPKILALRKTFGSKNVIAPHLPVDPVAVVRKVTKIIDDIDGPLILVGTSLGGFWARYFSHKYQVPCVIVNPVISPSSVLQSHVGLVDKSTRLLGVKVESAIKYLSKLESELGDETGDLTHIFLAKDDPVLPIGLTLATLPVYNSIIITDDGGHIYLQHWPLVTNRVRLLLGK